MTSKVLFSKFVVTSQVFYQSKYTYALVNLKPIVPGHILIVPLRVVSRLQDLTPEESMDYMQTLQLIHRFILNLYKADSLNIAIQDGPEAGQSVPHLHTHIIPRYKTDGYGDEIYRKIEQNDLVDAFNQLGEDDKDFTLRKLYFKENGAFRAPHDDDRHSRDMEVMEKEALWLAEELQKYRTES